MVDSSADAGDLTRRTGHALAAGLRAGEFSARELAQAHLAAAHRDNRGLNAWLSIDDERALAEADSADARWPPPAATDRRPWRPCRRSTACRSPSRTSSRWPAASAPPARGSSRATGPRTTPTSPSGSDRPAR